MASQPCLCFGPYRLAGPSGQLWRHSEVVPLPPKVAAVLWCLATQAGQLVTRESLFETVWAGTVVSDAVLTVCVRGLRRVLGDDPKRPRYIETVHRRGYRFVAPVERFETAAPGGQVLPPPDALRPASAPMVVGREAEMAQIQACLARARRGQRQVLFVTGEAGIGKTTLVEACVAALDGQETACVGRGQCVDTYGPGTGYLPVLEALGRLCRGPAAPTVLAALRQWSPTWLAQLPGVLPAAEQARLQRRTQGATRARMLRELAEALEALTQAQLGVLVLEDLHWSDPSTVELLTLLARRQEAARLLVLGTYRPTELILRAHPLKQAKAELHLHGQCTELILSYLQEPAVDAYVAHRFPTPIAQAMSPVLYQRTAGHPLFMVHMAEYLAQQVGQGAAAGAELTARVAAVAEAVPTGVQQLVELQLEHLSPEEQRVLEMASVAGVEFAVVSVAAGLQTPPATVEAVCEALARRGLFLEADGLAVWPDRTVSGQYQFRHTLYQQVLYRRLGEGRRVRGHRRIGTRLETGYGARAAEIAAALAGHFARGQDAERAVPYHLQAGRQALERSAHQEAISYLTAGLALLATLPETPARAQQELALQIALGPALAAAKGYTAAEVEQTYARAHALCQQVDETPQLFPALWGLCRFYRGRGALQTARELGEHLYRLAQREAEPTMLLEVHDTLGVALFFLGEYTAARMHLEHGIALTDPAAQPALALRHGEAPGVRCLAVEAWTLWCLGYPLQAVRRSQEALALARSLGHAHSLAFAQYFAGYLHYRRGEASMARAQTEALLTLATTQGFPVYVGLGRYWRGWWLAMQGQDVAGMAQMRQGLAAVSASGNTLAQPHCLLLLAEAAGHVGQVAEGLDLLAEALAMFEASGRGDLLGEGYRLRGELLLRQAVPDAVRAETCFQQALSIARRQQAKSWELRAALSLSRLWQCQGRREAAYDLLAPVYGWFTEGFDTADLREAQALLATLG